MAKKAPMRRVKGKTKNKKQAEAAELQHAADVLAAGAAKRKRDARDKAGTSPKRQKHVPQKVGTGGARVKLDVDQLDSPSRKEVLRNRAKVAAHRLRKKSGGVTKVSQAVRDDPTEAWREKATGHVNKNPERARQRAAAELAAALPKNPALHGPAVAAFMQHPVGKRAHAALDIEPSGAPKKAKRLDALSAMASDVGEGLALMQASCRRRRRPRRANTTSGSRSCRTTSMRRSRSSCPSPWQPTTCSSARRTGGMGGRIGKSMINRCQGALCCADKCPVCLVVCGRVQGCRERALLRF